MTDNILNVSIKRAQRPNGVWSFTEREKRLMKLND